jgi:hypothetical protein
VKKSRKKKRRESWMRQNFRRSSWKERDLEGKPERGS